MYLKKVEIQGFKSFAEKTEVVFNDRVTAIVGPNGSGKSNIADAIRWVLGEQSVKNLRGTRMEDIIFSGTEKRKALGYSEVTIIFDNSSGKIPIEYNEVAVTRRMFRSGESEYYINKNSCRLKDIRELFMDTGVGKEGYSIIGQGKIDEILSNKPEDRRNIFEEAAGIVKYKTKKQEALRKLDRTQANLTRLGDLLYEIKNQKENLQLEAEKAKEFQKLYGQLRRLDSSLSVYEVGRLNNKLEDVELRKESLKNEKEIIDADNLQVEEGYNTLKTSIEQLEIIIEEKRTLKMENIQEYEKSKNRVKILDERETHLQKEIKRLSEEIKKDRDFLLSGDTRMDSSVEEIERLKNESHVFKKYLNDKQEEREKINQELSKLENDIDALKRLTMETYSSLSDKRSESNTILSFKESIETRLDTIINEKNTIDKKQLVLISELDIKHKELDEKIISRDEIEDKINQTESHISKCRDKISIDEVSLQSYQAELESSRSSQKLYKNMEREYEGYYNSVKSLIKAINEDKVLGEGFIGTVADLFTVDKKYMKAIEVALGSSIQNIIVRDDTSARRLIDYLKTRKKGRATFLPLNTITGREVSVSDNDMKQFNIIGTAASILNNDSDYDHVFMNLLGRTIVSKSVEDALGYSKKTGFKTRIVTLDGEIINPGGSLTGGSTSNQSISILNRKQTLLDLGVKIESLKLDVDKYTSSIDELKNEIEIYSNDKDALVQSLSKVKLNITEIEKDIDNMDYQYKVQKESFISKENEISELQNELNELDIRKNELNNSQSQLKNSHDELEANLNRLQKEYDKKRSVKNILDNEVTETRIKLNAIERTLSNHNERLQENQNTIVETRESVSLKEENLERIKKEIQDNTVEKMNLIEYIQEQATIEEEESSLLKKKVQDKESLMKEFYQLQDRLRELTKRQSTVERELNKLEVDQAKSQLQIDNILEKLENDYELTLEEAEKLYADIEDIRGTKKIISDTKQAIKDLGNVNISSIEEYETIVERYNFLNKQIIDLNGAKEDIESVVKGMEKKMRIQFKKSFQEINERFSETFSVLFNGGKARLEIEEEDDILTAGIEIMAQPPGKKLQSLTLLSGGEKSLTAVALLFAILKTKPSPFCILDEIDAALDEANISRYTAYLNSLEDDTQFVLITHRKTTMEIADVLYGVTMEEEGVSRMISLKLKDYDEIAS
ncbi:chromosome segregation protein SMC [Gudongella sp. DL1XJH-153]|uniref:chromosome segregation protein SMC n=1 Tax=Gudongella sp. DL1XJH-153 TaxID=3409804 RepID=UPI003BB52B2E